MSRQSTYRREADSSSTVTNTGTAIDPFRHSNRNYRKAGRILSIEHVSEISGEVTMSKHTNRSAEQAARKKTIGGEADGRPKTKDREEVRKQHKHTSRKP